MGRSAARARNRADDRKLIMNPKAILLALALAFILAGCANDYARISMLEARQAWDHE